MKLRLFVAAEIDDRTRAFATQVQRHLADAGVTGRFEAPEKLHLTVAFLGSVAAERLAQVQAALRDACASCQRFDLRFDRLGAFPNARRPRLLWLGPTDEDTSFTKCARVVRTAFEQLGFVFDHDTRAHLTICRPAFVPKHLLAPLSTTARLSVHGLTLMRSLPAGPTTRYEALERTPFPH
jgi:RNA 2',3'-cyclic 3'-phosphodiesterase